MSNSANVQSFYDESTQIWLNSWGDQMHHGYYPDLTKAKFNHKQAQIEMIELLVQWGGIQGAQHILDLGCGVGGVSRYLSNKYKAPATGITISQKQAFHGQKLNKQSIYDVQTLYGDVMKIEFEPNSYDLILAIESAEHMAPLKVLFKKIKQTLRTNGVFLMAAWTLAIPFEQLNPAQKKNVRSICSHLHIPVMNSKDAFICKMSNAGLSRIETKEITQNVVPFWKGVRSSAFSWSAIRSIFTIGLYTWKGAWGFHKMKKAYQNGTLQYVIYSARK